MSALAVEHAYRYAAPSQAIKGSDGMSVQMATSGSLGNPGARPYFFQGSLNRPRPCALALRVLSGLVGARFYTPPATKARALRLADPLVTCAGGLLRFEGFSTCCGAYGRVDLSEAAFRGLVVRQGTTNVDFNAPMRAALSQIRDHESVGFAIGADEVTLLRGADQVIERKVALPARWIKGLIETGAFQARMKLAFTVQKIEATRFIKSLPKATSPRTKSWVGLSGPVLRVMQVASKTAVPISGIERLRVVEELAPYILSMRIYSDPVEGATAWEFDLGGLTFTLVLSPEVWRGFSGEGQA
ncbi:MAG: SWIM zinc finger family protein, partial [Verrucomicrobiota bacterium]